MAYKKKLDREFDADFGRLDNANFEMDWPRYRAVKAEIVPKYRETEKEKYLMAIIDRWESHPCFGGTKADQARHNAAMEARFERNFKAEMVSNARRGRHFVYANVWFDGTITYLPEYVETCKEIGVSLPKSRKTYAD